MEGRSRICRTITAEYYTEASDDVTEAVRLAFAS